MCGFTGKLHKTASYFTFFEPFTLNTLNTHNLAGQKLLQVSVTFLLVQLCL